jgi:hypothetical protein
MAKAVALQSGVGQVLRGATAARKIVGEKGKEIGLGIQRSALGSRFGDYLQSAKRAGLAPENKQLESLTKDLALDANEELSEQVLSTKVKQAQNRLLEQNILPKTRDPAELGAFLQNEFSSLTAKVNSAIDAVDASKKQIAFVDTSKTNKLLQSGKYSGDQIKEVTDYIADRQNQFQSTDRGKLRFLQEQKKGIADRYKLDQKGLAPVYRSLYNDYKRHIEKYAPSVRDLNRQVSDLKTVEIPIYRGIALQEAFDTMGAVNRLKYTTGGLMAPIIAGGVGALPFGAVGGAVLGTALAAGATRPGKRIIGETLTQIAPTIGQPTGIGNVLGRSIRAGQTLETEPQAEPAMTTMPTAQMQGGITLDAIRNELQRRGLSLSNMVGPSEAQAAVRPPKAETLEGIKWTKAPASVSAEINKQEPLIQAMIYQESRGNPKAKSKAGAAGLMQLMPGTAKELRVKDVFDAKQNIAAGTKYIEKMRSKFGDDSLALAAYNWGPGNVSKAVRQAAKALKKDASQVTWDDILSEVTVPTETRKYVQRVFRLREQFSKQTTEPQEGSNVDTALKVAKTIASIAPVTGEIISAKDTFESALAGDYSGAAINAAGVIPFVGAANRLRKGMKIVDALSDASKIAATNKAVELEKFIAKTGLNPELAEKLLKSSNAVRASEVKYNSKMLKSAKEQEAWAQKLVDDASKRVQRAFEAGRSKAIIDQHREFLEEMKNALAKAKTETNTLQCKLRKLLQDT